MADGTAATVAAGRRRGECFAGRGEPATCDNAKFGKLRNQLPAVTAPLSAASAPAALSNFRSGSLQSESGAFGGASSPAPAPS